MKKAFIVSHTHWDREWYQSFDRFRYLLVRTMDEILEVLECTEFQHFHLDGQTIVLDDYLKLRPENRERIKRFVAEGRLSIGPWYVLQDEFLTSGEANVRNLLRGLRDGAAFGKVSEIGYLPDTFGHFSQMPQILTEFGIHSALFCRGLVSSYDAVRSKVEKTATDVVWEGADGSRVFGVFGSDWYNNANEISAERPEESVRRAVQNLEGASLTGNYLLFNGCDHQPVQRNLPELLPRIREKLRGEIEVVHGSYEDYIAEVSASGREFPVYRGELTGNEADGRFAFIHTASARVHLKLLNDACQNLLERTAEPIGVFADIEGKPYDKAFFDLSWEYLMQNHPHDSICCCGVDDVYTEMETRYRKSRDVARQLTEDNAGYIAEKIDCAGKTDADTKAVVVFNANAYADSPVVRAEVDFAEDAGIDLSKVTVCDFAGTPVASEALAAGRAFWFENPADSFRRCECQTRVTVEFCAKNLPPFGYKTFLVKRNGGGTAPAPRPKNTFENAYYALKFLSDGSFSLLVKETGTRYTGLNAFEDGGDVGDEYTFASPERDTVIATSGRKAKVTCVSASSLQTVFEVEHVMHLPAGFERLDEAGEAVVKYDGSVGENGKRRSRRSSETVDCRVVSRVTLYPDSPEIRVATTVENRADNHRLRAVFPFPVAAGSCFSHTPYDVVERPLDYRPHWGLSDSADRQQAFSYVKDEKDVMMLANRGLYEYEITGGNTYKLTLLRSIDELGDWGYFATPGAKMRGTFTFEYALFTGAAMRERQLVRRALRFNAGEAFCTQIRHGGRKNLPAEKSYFSVETDAEFSALKRAEDDTDYILRVYNPYPEEVSVRLDRPASRCTLSEQAEDGGTDALAAKKILTLKLRRNLSQN